MDAPGATAPATDTQGTDGADTYLVNAGTLQNFDTIVGGAGDDALISTAALIDDQFTSVSSIETVRLSNAAGAFGAKAAAAGVKTISVLGAAQNINLTGFNKDVALNGTAFADTVTVSLADAGNKTLNLGNETTNVDVVTVAGLATAAAGSVQVNFTSSAVGNGTANNATIVGANGNVVLSDESNKVVSTVKDMFNVVGLDANGAVDLVNQNRGNFTVVEFGSSAADTTLEASAAAAGTAGGNVYINAGAGDDVIAANAASGVRHFIVGGTGKDVVNVNAASVGTVVVLGGDDADTVNVNATAASAVISVNGGNGDDLIKFAGKLTANTATAADNDTITGGEGRDTLEATSADLTAIDNKAANAVQSISGIEAVTVSNAEVGTTIVLGKIQAGIDTVNLNGSDVPPYLSSTALWSPIPP